MTNEEHIEQLKKLRSFHNGSYGRSINKAIEALEQEPCTDAVSRQAILRFLVPTNEFTANELIQAIKNYVKSLPPVTPTRPKGKWIDGDAKCPCCGKDKFEGLDADIWADWKPKYCPNCGADMREGE